MYNPIIPLGVQFGIYFHEACHFEILILDSFNFDTFNSKLNEKSHDYPSVIYMEKNYLRGFVRRFPRPARRSCLTLPSKTFFEELNRHF